MTNMFKVHSKSKALGHLYSLFSSALDSCLLFVSLPLAEARISVPDTTIVTRKPGAAVVLLYASGWQGLRRKAGSYLLLIALGVWPLPLFNFA